MRVIAGTARRLNLLTPKGMETRPTLDREKETLFNMIQFGLSGASFLDLFAGSGQMGIEALSRGAETAYFVDQGRESIECIRQNLAFTRLADRGVVMAMDVMSALRQLEQKGVCFDYIFMDPPYDRLLEKQVLEYLSGSVLCGEETIIIVESHLDTDFSYLSGLPFSVYKEKCYKNNKHTIIKR